MELFYSSLAGLADDHSQDCLAFKNALYYRLDGHPAIVGVLR